MIPFTGRALTEQRDASGGLGQRSVSTHKPFEEPISVSHRAAKAALDAVAAAGLRLSEATALALLASVRTVIEPAIRAARTAMDGVWIVEVDCLAFPEDLPEGERSDDGSPKFDGVRYALRFWGDALLPEEAAARAREVVLGRMAIADPRHYELTSHPEQPSDRREPKNWPIELGTFASRSSVDSTESPPR